MAEKRVDSYWGSEAMALLPRTLRAMWAGEPLPEWVAKELRLGAEATAAALDQSVWGASGTQTVSDRLRNFILNLVSARRSEIRAARVFAQPLPYWLKLGELPFSTRTRNCLVFAGLLGDPEQASNLTYGRLMDVRSMGAVSILEFACLAEAALEKASTPPRELAHRTTMHCSQLCRSLGRIRSDLPTRAFQISFLPYLLPRYSSCSIA